MQTERYDYVIYSWNYGIEIRDLIGEPIPYVYAELERRVTDALLQDDRITDVIDFDFSNTDESVLMKFTVVSNLGEFESEMSVNV